jgi:hypothetical protein
MLPEFATQAILKSLSATNQLSVSMTVRNNRFRRARQLNV